jgi:hypothetical protein
VLIIGQGVSSGLEDCLILSEIIQKLESNWFKEYNLQRIPDTLALGQYAAYLNEDVRFEGENVARILFRILEGGLSTRPIQQHLHYGKYEQVIGHWLWVRYWVLGLCRVVCYPIAVILFPLHSFKMVMQMVL